MTEPGAPKPPGVHIPHEKRFLDGEGNLLAAMGVAIPEAPDMQREELRFAIAEETGSAPEEIVLAADGKTIYH